MTSVLFSVAELWVIRNSVRHEMQAQDTWRVPPANYLLNTKIAEALLFCEEAAQSEAAVDLTADDTYVLDYCIQDLKDADGRPIGRPILLKAYRARAAINDGPTLDAEEPESPTAAEVAAKLMEDKSWRRKSRRRPPPQL